MLEALFPVAVQKLDRQTLVDEKDAKFDVYNYAARFVCVPKFSVKQVRSFARHKGASKFMVEVTIALEEQGIEAVGRESDLRAAEVAASVQFKAEAERYHAEHGDQSIVIKDATALNTANVKNFFDFYRIENRNTKLGVSVTGSKEFGNSWEAQATIDGELLGSPVRMESKKAAEEVANLVAAVSLSQEDPDLLERFQEALSGGTGNILAPVRPIGLEVDADTALILSKVVEEVRSVGLPRVAEQLTGDTDSEVTTRTRTQTRLSEREIAIRSEAMMRRQDAFRAEPKLAEKRALKESLPMTQYREKVLEQVVNNMYSVIVGATGSGKTTQVPQILLEDAISHNSGAKCNIVCTQPRRIAATSVARRVASERNEELQDTVGYQVRFDAKLPQPGGSITYCTTGILLQQLQRAPDEVFDSLSHIIIDEVHERDIIIDFLMIILKKTVSARLATGKSVPRVVLMSATIDTELFAKYFQQSTPEGGLLPCPSLSVPGRTFPVKEKYYNEIVSEMEQSNPSGLSREITSDPVTREYMNLESSFKATTGSSAAQDENGEATIDWKRERTLAADGSEVFNEKEDGLVPVALVAATIAHITRTTSEGAILVFLPGYDEIKKVADTLRTTSPLGIDFNNEAAFKLSMLHSSVPAAEQAEVFAPVPADCRKIILSTNIAETSVTIPDVQHVVDTGKLREKRYDQLRRITKLQCTWISKSNAKQRAGRAGRVQNGNYYALYSKARFESLRAVGLPEMLRSDLQEICLDIKAQAFKSPIRDFLSESIEPPPPAAVDASVVNLKALQALTEDEKLTALGRLLASLPVHPSLGKMIVLGVIFRCLDPMIILGAALNERSPFVAPPDKRQEARQAHTRFLQGSGSDHVAVINAVRQMRLGSLTHGQHAMHEFGIRNFIHTGAFRTIHQTAQQIEEVLVNASLIPRPTERDRLRGELGNASLNKNSANVQLIKALTLAGVHPNLAVSNGNSFRTPGEKHAMLHPSSLNFNQNMRRRVAYEDSAPTSLYSYTTMNRSNDGKQILLRDTTACSPLMAALFGGRLKDQRNIITMDKWLPFYVKGDWGAARKIMDFRSVLDIVSIMPAPATFPSMPEDLEC